MHFTNALLVAGAVASAKQTIRIDVGKDGLQYSAPSVKAAVGDELEFHYYPKNHTVTQSSFDKPCQPLAGGFHSGFVPTQPDAAGLSTFTVTVKDKKPIWFYCGQADHCKKGMVGAVNAPATGKTFLAFKDLAANTNSTSVPPTAPVGGTLVVKKGNGSVGTTSMTTAHPTGTDCITTTYQTTYTSNGVVCTTAVTTTVPVTNGTPKPTVPVAHNGAAKLGAGALAAAAAVAML